MQWGSRFQSDPRYERFVRVTTGRPSWVLRATGTIAVALFILPVVAFAVFAVAALAVTLLAWVLFSAIARVIDAVTGSGGSGAMSTPNAHATGSQTTSDPPPSDASGRENVRVIHRQ